LLIVFILKLKLSEFFLFYWVLYIDNNWSIVNKMLIVFFDAYTLSLSDCCKGIFLEGSLSRVVNRLFMINTDLEITIYYKALHVGFSINTKLYQS